MYFDTSQRISAASGMLLTVMLQIQSEEMVRTAILAAIGGAASYAVTLLIKFLIYCYRKRS